MIAKHMEQSKEVFLKFGYLGVLFFTIKGLLWLILPVVFTLYLN